MKKYGCILGAFIALIVKGISWLYRVVFKTLADVFVYLGLYVPGIYFLYGLILQKFCGLNLSAKGEESALFTIGFVLCIICAIIITVRHLVIRPFRSVVGKKGKQKRREIAPRPLIYQSRIYPELTVYEYPDRFDLYRTVNGELKLVNVEYKR